MSTYLFVFFFSRNGKTLFGPLTKEKVKYSNPSFNMLHIFHFLYLVSSCFVWFPSVPNENRLM